jgi:hypothetical protein
MTEETQNENPLQNREHSQLCHKTMLLGNDDDDDDEKM